MKSTRIPLIALLFLSTFTPFTTTAAKMIRGKSGKSKAIDIALYAGSTMSAWVFLESLTRNAYKQHYNVFDSFFNNEVGIGPKKIPFDTNNHLIVEYKSIGSIYSEDLGGQFSQMKKQDAHISIYSFLIALFFSHALYKKNNYESLACTSQKKQSKKSEFSSIADTTLIGACGYYLYKFFTCYNSIISQRNYEILAWQNKKINRHTMLHKNLRSSLTNTTTSFPDIDSRISVGREVKAQEFFLTAAALFGIFYLKNCWESQEYEVDVEPEEGNQEHTEDIIIL